MAVGKEAVVTDAVKAVGQAVEQEAANELIGVEGHHLGLVPLAVIAPLEADPGPVDGDEPAVGDRHAVGVAAEVGEHLLGRAERRLGVDHPVDLAQAFELMGEGRTVDQPRQITEEAQAPGVESRLQLLQEQPPIEPREHVDGQEEGRPAGEPALAIRRQPAAGDNAMEVRVMGERLPPGVEDGDDDLPPEKWTPVYAA